MRFRIPLSALAVVLTSVLLAGCDQTDLDPFDNDARYYTVWGYLDPLESEQVVRVVPVTRFPEHIQDPTEPQASIDAEVYSTDMSSGERTRWQHELVELEDGTYGHIFRARMLVWAGRTYKLEVIRSDGKMAVAETTVPIIREPAIIQRSDVMYNADSTEIWQDVEIPGVASPWDISAVYVAGATTNFHVHVPYGRVGERTEEGNWRTRIHISRDQLAVRDYLLTFPNENGATLTTVGIQIRILDSAWDPPEGVFDPEVLAQPGVIGNVDGGHGFFGSMGLHREDWFIDTPQRLFGYPLIVSPSPSN